MVLKAGVSNLPHFTLDVLLLAPFGVLELNPHRAEL